MAKKTRVEIPQSVAAQVLFESDRTCCICRKQRPVQIHHIDENPSNSSPENLAVVCFDCHHDTQIRGGFGRKLDAAVIVLYRRDWLERVAVRRGRDGSLHTMQAGSNIVGQLRYLQSKESSDEHRYSFEAEYPQLGAEGSLIHVETNLAIAKFINHNLEEFRKSAMVGSERKNEINRDLGPALAWDSLNISYKVATFNDRIFAVEFSFWSYYAMAAHPNTVTRTLNFRLYPSKELGLDDVFDPSNKYLDKVSDYCVKKLHNEQAVRFHDPTERFEQLKQRQDQWILSGAGPTTTNYERFVFEKGGMRFFFDAYQVGSYAEGRYDVLVPLQVLLPLFRESTLQLLKLA